MTSKFHIRAGSVPAYHPANHEGTSNQRLIGRDNVGAKNVEVVLGTISRGGGALPHAHPGVEQGHDSIFSYLTAAPHPEHRAGFRNTISVDQLAAEYIGDETRFASLSLAGEGFSLSWTRSGALVPSDPWPASVFARLFIEGKPDDVQAQIRRLRDNQSILDTVGEQAKEMRRWSSAPNAAPGTSATPALSSRCSQSAIEPERPSRKHPLTSGKT